MAIEADTNGVTADAVLAQRARVLFGGTRGLQVWFARWRADGVETAWYARASDAAEDASLDTASRADVLPLVLRRDGRLLLVDSSLRTRRGDQVEFAVDAEQRTQAREWLASAGWTRID